MTKRVLSLLTIAMSLSGFVAIAGDTVGGLPLHVERLSENALRLWVGDYISSTAVSALSTDKGLVVIDTTESPALDEQFRKIITKEFGRADFVYLINTHEHRDHTTGNGVYADCEIIAHEYCAEGMKNNQGNRQRTIDWLEQRIPELKKELAELEKDSDEYKQLREEVLVRKMVLKSVQSGLEPTYPTKTFSDSMKLDMGNMTIELYYAGGTHTASDIFVFVPEEGLLFTGDMMADVWLTDTPGCLQAFSMRQGTKRDIPLMLENWNGLIVRKDEIGAYIPAHWNGELSYEGFVDRYNYVDTLYAGVMKGAKEGMTAEELFSQFEMQAAFPHLVDTPGFTNGWVHNGTLLALWSDVTGVVSASNALGEAIDEGKLEVAIKEMKVEHAKGSDKYYFIEAELNGLGYRFLQQEEVENALAVFKLNVDIYPDSWNVYDSLAEAYKVSGQNDLAVRNYNRSLELNPENENGTRMLEEIETTLAKK